MRRAVTVVGIGADGCAGLSSRAASAVAEADVLAGGERHLAFFPQFRGERVLLGRDVAGAVERIAALADEHAVCVLASGDPLFFGVGARVCARVGAEHVEILPHPSSIQWAFARAGLAWEGAALLSVHGRALAGIAVRLRRARKAALLTGGAMPDTVARHLLDHGERGLEAWICEDLCGPGERVRRFGSLDEVAACVDVSPLNVLLLARTDPAWRPPPVLPFLSEDALDMRRPRAGLVTKREVRALALATLAIRPDAVVWDVGAGSGSVAIEAASLAPEGKVFAVERDAESAMNCRANARAHGMDHVSVLEGEAPAALEGLDAPDAVFVGGSGGALGAIVARALERLRPRGRIAVAAVTLETLEEARRALAAAGAEPEVTLVSSSRGVPLAGRLRLDPLTPVFLVAASRPEGRP